MQEKTISIILAGGIGSRLHPLTAERAKPAVPFGGRYRIIDFTLSNCLHSGLRRILVLTQYKSQSFPRARGSVLTWRTMRSALPCPIAASSSLAKGTGLPTQREAKARTRAS